MVYTAPLLLLWMMMMILLLLLILVSVHRFRRSPLGRLALMLKSITNVIACQRASKGVVCAGVSHHTFFLPSWLCHVAPRLLGTSAAPHLLSSRSLIFSSLCHRNAGGNSSGASATSVYQLWSPPHDNLKDSNNDCLVITLNTANTDAGKKEKVTE